MIGHSRLLYTFEPENGRKFDGSEAKVKWLTCTNVLYLACVSTYFKNYYIHNRACGGDREICIGNVSAKKVNVWRRCILLFDYLIAGRSAPSYPLSKCLLTQWMRNYKTMFMACHLFIQSNMLPARRWMFQRFPTLRK